MSELEVIGEDGSREIPTTPEEVRKAEELMARDGHVPLPESLRDPEAVLKGPCIPEVIGECRVVDGECQVPTLLGWGPLIGGHPKHGWYQEALERLKELAAGGRRAVDKALVECGFPPTNPTPEQRSLDGPYHLVRRQERCWMCEHVTYNGKTSKQCSECKGTGSITVHDLEPKDE